mmetsp:Transcript_2676/g.4503  ORF Transcript_2676/g.4503 Transcript_2676/m.4503 type:complete len:122 (-) Transcript_2676:2050-2415(-)
MIPLSFCLPSHCNSSRYFKSLTDTLESKANDMLVSLKGKVDIDGLYDKIPEDTNDTPLMKQLVTLFSNRTLLSINPVSTTEDKDDQLASTQGVWDGILIFCVVVMALLCMLPNIFVGWNHF